MFEIDTKDLKRLERDLKDGAPKAFAFAQRNTVNRSAFALRGFWQDEIGNRFLLRNQYTQRSVRVEQTRTLTARRMVAVVGSIAPYMAIQEHGGTDTGVIPTEVASGQAMGSRPRTKTVRAANKLSAIRLTSRYRSSNRRQRNLVAIKQAVMTGNRFVFLELQDSEGLFRITGGRRKPKVKMIYNTRSSVHRVPPHPTLGPALVKLERAMPKIAHKALVEQLKRHKVFGY
jgi:hypothetical protein